MYLFFRLHWAFAAARRLRSGGGERGYTSWRCAVLSRRTPAVEHRPQCVQARSFSSRALEHRLSSAQAELLCGTWDLLSPRMEPASPYSSRWVLIHWTTMKSAECSVASLRPAFCVLRPFSRLGMVPSGPEDALV